MFKKIKEVYSYKEMLLNLVRRDLRTRYKGSILGFFWTFLNPLLQLIVYTIVFSEIMRIDIENFYLYLFIGLVPWTFFQSSILGGAGSIIVNKDLVKKVYFPKEVIPISVVTTNFMNMMYTMAIVFLAILFSGLGFNLKILVLPLILFIEYVLVLGITLIVSALTVYFRDLEHIFGILLMAWFYLTPIVYPLDMVPDNYLHLFKLNPMTHIIVAYRDILFYNQVPDYETLVSILSYAGIFLVVGFGVFSCLERGFAEEI